MALWNAFSNLGSGLSLTAPKHYLEWIPGESPLSTATEVVAAVIAYVGLVHFGQLWMADRKPFKLRTLFMAHNLFLSLGSLVLLSVILEQVLPYWWANGTHNAICARSAWTPRMETLYLFNYYFKYYELLDTAFLVLMKKKVIFLHFYHHPATAVLCFVQLNGHTSISWVPITLNLAVHTVMYMYYYTTAAWPGYQPWYKRYITKMQIAQFVVDLVAVYYGTYQTRAGFQRFSHHPWVGQPNCYATSEAALVGCGILTSYLFLFVGFYLKTYKRSANAPKPQVQAKQVKAVEGSAGR